MAAILDVGLPTMANTEVCSALRSAQNGRRSFSVPPETTKLTGSSGWNLAPMIYITKPFSPREVVARVKAVLRRTAGRESTPDDLLAMKGVEVDANARRVTVNGVEIELTPTEFDLLAYLLKNPGRVFSRDQLLTDVWGTPVRLGLALSTFTLPNFGANSNQWRSSERSVASDTRPTNAPTEAFMPTDAPGIHLSRRHGSCGRRLTVCLSTRGLPSSPSHRRWSLCSSLAPSVSADQTVCRARVAREPPAVGRCDCGGDRATSRPA